MFNINDFSIENLERIRKILRIVLDELEIQGEINRLLPVKIPLVKFEKEGFFYDEVNIILNRIGHNENGNIRVVNEDLKQTLLKSDLEIEQSLTWLPECQKKEKRGKFCKIFNLSSEDDLHKYLLLQVEDLSILTKLKEIKEAIDKKLEKTTKTRAKKPIMQVEIIKAKGLEKGLEKIAKTKKEEEKKFALKLPTGTRWEGIEIKFQNESNIEIFINGRFWKETNYETLEFYRSGTKDKLPDIQWRFLTLLSVCQESDKIQATIENMALSLGRYLDKKVSKEMCEQIKSKLSKRLQEIFGINEEPFYSYKECGFYQPKFKLKPIPALRGTGEPFMTKTPYDDNKKYSQK